MGATLNITRASSGETDVLRLVSRLFDADFYLLRNPELTVSDPLEHFVQTGRLEGRAPNALFDPAHYRRQLRGARIGTDPLTHYIVEGAEKGLSPHPLFDPAYYVRQSGAIDGLNPLAHYLSEGGQRGLSPHPLFDPEYYAECHKSELGGRNPLEHYLMRESWDGLPHYLFSDAVYVAEIGRLAGRSGRFAFQGGAPLAHYVLEGYRFRPKTHPLFDPADYALAIGSWCRRTGDLSLQRSYERASDPLRHYLDHTAQIGLSATPYFDPQFFRTQVPEAKGDDPLRQYLLPAGYAKASPHPAIDLDHYARHASTFFRDATPSILHLLATDQPSRQSPHPAFDPEFYAATNADLQGSGHCPILHFITHGMEEDRAPNVFFSQQYLHQAEPRHDFGAQNAVSHYLSSEWTRRTRLLFVSHDASLTGAPGTILRLIETIGRRDNVECFAVLGGGGPRVPDFRRAAHTFVLEQPFYMAPVEHLNALVEQILAVTEGNEPVAAIVNSAESRAIVPLLARAGIPVISLIHEAADLYPDNAFEGIAVNADRIIFGSRFVYEKARAAISLPEDRCIVRGQGLQQERMGTMPRDQARTDIRTELGIDDDTFLVLGCGTIDHRKGADLFTAVAVETLKQENPDRPFMFVWIGEGQAARNGFSAFLQGEIRTRGLADRIRFIGARSDVEPYFMAADAFMMPSRSDPFPCVVQEAMASALPVVAFREGGGTVEMIGDEAGVVVPLGDTVAMAKALIDLSRDSEKARAFGSRGRELVEEKWQFADYADFVADQVAEIAGRPVSMFGAASDRASMARKQVFFLCTDWQPSAFTAHIVSQVQALNREGFAAELVFTRGRFGSREGRATQPEPGIPFRYLQPDNVEFADGKWRTSDEAVGAAIGRFCREVGPAVLVDLGEPVLLALAPALPTDIAVVSVAGSSEEEIGRVYNSGRSLDRIIALSDAASARLIDANPALAAKITSIRPAGAGASKLKRLRKSQSGTSEPLSIHIHANISGGASIRDAAALIAGLKRDGANGINLIAGRVPHNVALANIAAQLGLSEVDILLPRDPKTVPDSAAANACAVFLEYDRSTITLVAEAMRAGAVVVLVDPTEDVAELVDVGVTGIIFKRLSRDLIAKKVLALISEPDSIASLSGAAADRAGREDLTAEGITAAYAAMLDDLFFKIENGLIRRKIGAGSNAA